MSLSDFRWSRVSLWLLLSAFCGFCWMAAHVQKSSQFQARQLLSLDEFKSLLLERVFVIDARPQAFYDQGHIPGAMTLPLNSFDPVQLVGKIHPDDTIIVYCSDIACHDSHKLAERLSRSGYAHILIFSGGLEEWSSAGLPVMRNTP